MPGPALNQFSFFVSAMFDLAWMAWGSASIWCPALDVDRNPMGAAETGSEEHEVFSPAAALCIRIYCLYVSKEVVV